MLKIIEKSLIQEFQERNIFSREELFNFFKKFEPDLKEGTFGWRIYSLKNKNIIKSIRRGYYTVTQKPIYQPEISKDLLKLAKGMAEWYKDVNYCLWDTDWLNEFSQHQSAKNITVIEIEKEFVESLFYKIKDNFKLNVYLDPDEKVIEYYVAESQYAIVIKKLITRSPIIQRSEKKTKFATPQLEKLLVDLFAERSLFYFYQGAELIHVYKNAFINYPLNYTTFYSYAKRRGCEEHIKAFITDDVSGQLNDNQA